MKRNRRFVVIRHTEYVDSDPKNNDPGLTPEGLKRAVRIADWCGEHSQDWGRVQILHSDAMRTIQLSQQLAGVFPKYPPQRAAWTAGPVDLNVVAADYPWIMVDTLVVCCHLPSIKSLLSQVKGLNYRLMEIKMGASLEFAFDLETREITFVGALN